MSKNDSGSLLLNIIVAGTNISGEIKPNGDIRIEGTVIGTIISKGKVVIGQTGLVEGEIFCQNADVSGRINGNITISELLSLKSTANIDGNIVTKKLATEPGANFSGLCSMGKVISMEHDQCKESKSSVETA